MSVFPARRRHGICVAILFSFGAPLIAAQQAPAPQQRMTFFVTSEGSGKGADLGGLAGADQRCQMLAVPEIAPGMPISALKLLTSSR